MGDASHIHTIGDYSKPSHEGYRNTIELPVGNNVVPLRSDTIRLVQNGCTFHGLRSKDPNQHLKDFLKHVDSLDLDSENKERTRLRLFQFSLRDQASNWLERLPAGSITTWEDLTTRFLAQFFPPGRTVKLRNDILMFQQHHGESLSEAWTQEINDRMAEMFGLLKELTTSKAPEKVVIREEAKSPVTKNVNSIFIARGEKERNDDNDVATGDDIKKPTETKMGMPVKEVENENEAKNGIKNEPIKKARKEETTEAPSSQLVEYYLKLKMFD
ncbi:zinc finger, CCHC-type containing protein [Tanacetum coccineum]